MASSRTRMASRAGAVALLGLAVAATVVAVDPPLPNRSPAGLVATVVARGLTLPTVFRFADDGTVVVGEKRGTIVALRGGAEAAPEPVADLSREVYDVWDHGLLGLALDPSFPEKPYVYVSYTYNAPMGDEAPRWPSRNGSDYCPNPPGILKDGCITSGRLSVLTVRNGGRQATERVLIEDWCHQSNTHSVGDLQFGHDGALFMAGGDGAFYKFADYGQRGNPCGDPPEKAGVSLERPTAEGGSLRAQDLLTPDDPLTLDGTLIRIDPKTGRGDPRNPLAESADENARRVVAYGFKQPFRFTIRPGTDEVWIGDVGHGRWEEIDRVEAAGEPVENFGWPCYEGGEPQVQYQGAVQIATLGLCRTLYQKGGDAVTKPFFAYPHYREALPNDRCPTSGSAISGLAFVEDGPYPGELANALYFTDSSRGCIWALPIGDDGLPDASRLRLILRRAGVPVDLQVGPDGHLYYLDFIGGRVVRLDASK